MSFQNYFRVILLIINMVSSRQYRSPVAREYSLVTIYQNNFDNQHDLMLSAPVANCGEYCDRILFIVY